MNINCRLWRWTISIYQHDENEKKVERPGWKRERHRSCFYYAFSIFLNISSLFLLGICLLYLTRRPHKSSQKGRAMPELFHNEVMAYSVQRIFMPDHLFNPSERNNASEEAWETLHKRFVIIDKPARYGLPPSEPFPRGSDSDNEIYAPAVFHQLHCLRLMRFSWYSLISNGAKILSEPIDVPNNPHGEALGPHIEHCFDFLRQALMCHADLALEPWVEDDGITRRPTGSTGWGTLHQCRRWDKVLEWVEGHHGMTLVPK